MTVARWRVVFAAFIFVVLGAVSLAVVAPFASNRPPLWRELITGLAAGGCVFVLTIIFVKLDGITLRDVGVATDRRSLQRFLFGSFIGISSVAIWALLSEAAGHVHWLRRPNADVSQVPLAFVAYVALAGREELAFRGYPLRRLNERFGRTVAIVSIAILFALEHRLGGESWVNALIGVGLGAVVFSIAALATKGLAVPLGIHAAWNFGQWALGLKGTAGVWIPAGRSDGPAFVAGMAIYVAVMTCVAVGLLWWDYRRRARELRP